jgi:hypothetical protein
MRIFRRRWAVVRLTPARSAISRALAGAVERSKTSTVANALSTERAADGSSSRALFTK